MTVILGSDAAGKTLKNIIKDYLLENNYDVKDVTEVNKDFVDSKKRYRKYYLTADVGPEGHKIKKRLTKM